MLKWYRETASKHGVWKATRFALRVKWSSTRSAFAGKYLPDRFECPCCGWKGARFRDYLQVGYTIVNAECPVCDSQSRHRALYLWLKNSSELAQKKGTALIFAPEKSIAPLWNNVRGLKVICTDILTRPSVHFVADLQKMPLADQAIDIVWCHHVLEHIPNDGLAIGELYRIMRAGESELIVSVPMGAGPTTDEYGFCDETISGHWRLYGDDFEQRLSRAGFQVERLNLGISMADRRRYGILDEPVYRCRKGA
jgi:SAM-dependent methyltransferase